MFRHIIISLIFSYLLASIHIFSQETHFNIDTVQFESEILKESRQIIIYKSENIQPQDSVWLIYMLDGEYSDYKFQELRKQFRDSISNLIGIGIVNTDRRRDLLYINGAGKFLDFITSELVPQVETDYRVIARMLFGHSFGGSFVIYALINKPDCFNYFIASSPTPIMDLIEKENYRQVDSLGTHRVVFYFSMGSKDMRQVRKWSMRLNENLSGMRFQNLDWRFEIFEGKNHNNSDLVALLHGLTDFYIKFK